MKISNIKYQISNIIISMMMISCSFLNEEPHSGQPENVVITSDVILHRQAVLSLYDHIGSGDDGVGLQGTYRGIYDLQTFASNEAIIPVRGGDWWDGGLWMDLYEHNWAVDNECCENAWLYLYQLVGLCNHSLHLLEQYASLLTDEQQRTYDAEVRAVRALAYVYLIDLFGRVPLVTHYDMTVHEIHQSERSRVFQFIWSELQEVTSLLPDERSNSRGLYYGRITRPVAHFLLMKMALNAEVWTDDDWTDGVRPDGKTIQLLCAEDNKKRNAWETVVFYADNILHSNARYALCNSQTKCFEVFNEDATENIFTIPMNPNVYRNRFKNLFRSLHYQHAGALGYGGENGSCATLETLHAFGYGTSLQDCRFNISFFAGKVMVNNKPLVLSTGDTLVYHALAVEKDLTGSPYVATAGARMRKYVFDPGSIFDGQLQNSDIVLFRLADVYLMQAEALVRNGQNGQEPFDLVRMREPIALGIAGKPREATLENIYLERWMELVWEGWHRQDQIRFDKYSDRPEERYLTVFPIPVKAIQTNPNLTQNKGYE